ncbi:endonuclease V [Hydrogenimonas cancrithermarum]|uniref:Endonuclease V n=1 Tax=Hydrogenimonas cancrithermarum TaxID=2993563 RepID=A0ABN6WT64_9BACT|nr:endonuclease V [Hydrogenimonas cancrithermarum]BDY12276.1 endonuclease V [Hydrogenimonas cancrithermarum]
MIFALDVCYRGGEAFSAAVGFSSFEARSPRIEYTDRSDIACNYIPGEFYRRELPAVVHLIERYRLEPELLIVDGYVTLDENGRAGFGYALYEYFEQRVPVIGVAKSRFGKISSLHELYRGGSRRPLYITAAGIEIEEAKEAIGKMHGPYRIPDILRYVDRLSRYECGEGKSLPPEKGGNQVT